MCGKLDKRDRSKWGQSRIANYENGHRTPDLTDIKVIAQVFNVSPSDLAFSDTNFIPASLGSTKVPIISYVQAGNMESIFDLGDADGYECILTDQDLSENSFALRIKGDSMEPEFKEGDVIIIDPNVTPLPGEFVVAKNGSEEATFKKYKADGTDDNGNNHFQLIPLNDDYSVKSSRTEPLVIIGTMVEHRIFRRKR
ncbi:XRE family transcriptional regulator [Spirabiliibacterium mucosae]|uniref:LexA family transcriptional regulator n=1 Tax=Spirabiliibacterium mucosae TaxID=28156 RepID=UPI001F2179BF